MEEENKTVLSENEESAEEAQLSLDVYGLMHYSLNLFVVHAWQKMGFMPDPLTREVRVDLAEAKIAIDCADFLAGHLQSHLEEEVRRELLRQIRDLKVNYLDKFAQEGGKEA